MEGAEIFLRSGGCTWSLGIGSGLYFSESNEFYHYFPGDAVTDLFLEAMCIFPTLEGSRCLFPYLFFFLSFSTVNLRCGLYGSRNRCKSSSVYIHVI